LREDIRVFGGVGGGQKGPIRIVFELEQKTDASVREKETETVCS